MQLPDSYERTKRIRGLLSQFSGAGMPANDAASIEILMNGSAPIDTGIVAAMATNLNLEKSGGLRVTFQNGIEHLTEVMNCFAAHYPSGKTTVVVDAAFLSADVITSLADLHLKCIGIKLCAASIDTHRKLSGSDRFEQVCSMLRHICRSNSERRTPQRLFGVCDFDKRNIHEISRMVELFQVLGFTRVESSYKESALHEDGPQSLIPLRDEVDQLISAARRTADRLGIPFSSPPLLGEYKSWGPCSEFESPIVVAEDGRVYPCRATYGLGKDGREYLFGSCVTDSRDQFTYGDNYRVLRWASLDGMYTPTEKCLSCQNRFLSLLDLPDPSGKHLQKNREDAVRTFTETVVQLVERGDLLTALTIYNGQRSQFPSELPELARFDQLIAQIQTGTRTQQ